MDWESYGVVGFDLEPLLQGKTRIANVGVSHFISPVIYVGVGQANCHSLIQQ